MTHPFLSPVQIPLNAARAGAHWLRRLHGAVPTPCPVCRLRSHGGRLCGACAEAMTASIRQEGRRCDRCALRLDAVPVCPDCAYRPPAFERVATACDYAAPADALVGQFKAGAQWLLAPALAQLMGQAVRLQRLGDEAPGPALSALRLVPIPARSASVRLRGFSPAAELARYLARDLGAVHAPALLRRVHEGVRQTHAPRRARLQAGRYDFHCPVDLGGCEVAVVDDVMTTGSTLHHAAQCLRDAGAGRVWGIVLARTPMGRHREGN